MIDPIKPNDKDVFKKEALSADKLKISFRDSFLIIQLVYEKDDDSKMKIETRDNKCKNMYDLRKIWGYIFSIVGTINE